MANDFFSLVPRLLAAALLALGAAAAGAQAYYATAEEAVQALIDAAVDEGPDALLTVLGPDAEALRSGDPVADAAARADFVDKAVASAALEIEEGDDRASLLIGPDDWPFAIPLVKEEQGWRFDTAAGLEEIYNRRIGRNELHAIATARAVVDAQREYAGQDRDGDGIREYAGRIQSREGQRDGLYWPVVGGESESPLGPLVAEASAEGYRTGNPTPTPYHGYYYRILAAQGPAAPGGAKSYLDQGDLTGGFGLLAYPAEYGNSGIMTFVVNQQGIVFQKDLGEETAELAPAIDAYDPDASWTPVTD